MKIARCLWILNITILYTVHAQAIPPTTDAQEKLMLAASTAQPVNLSTLLPGLFNNIPSNITKGLNHFILNSVQLEEEHNIKPVSNIYDTFIFHGKKKFTGTILIDNFPIKASLHIYTDKLKQNVYSLSIQLPKSRLSQINPKLKALDSFSLKNLELIISEFDYKNEYDIPIARGLTIISHVNLTGPLKIFSILKEKAKTNKAIIIDSTKATLLYGNIPLNLAPPTFTLVIPFALGIDFTAIKKIPSELSKFLQKISTDTFQAIITTSKLTPTVNLQVGMKITTNVSPDPFIIQGFGILSLLSGKISFGGVIPTMIHITPWLGISELGIECVIDPSVEAVLAALGIPLSGIGFRGQVDVGKLANNASLEMQNKIELTTEGAINFILQVIGKNINFSNLLHLLLKMAATTQQIPSLSQENIPTLVFHKVMGRVAPWGGIVAQKKIEPGFALQAETTLFDQHCGLWIDVNPLSLSMSGRGWIPPLTLEYNNIRIFQFTGSNKNTTLDPDIPKNAPYVHFKFSIPKGITLKSSYLGRFAINGLFEIPALQLKQYLDMEYARFRFRATAESNNLGFGVSFNININPTKLSDFRVDFTFKDDFAHFLSRLTTSFLKEIQAKTVQELSKIDALINDLSSNIKQSQTKGISDTEKEMQKTNETIHHIKNKINQLKKECSNARALTKAIVCSKVGVHIASQETALAAQETYLHTLLKPGKEIIKGSTEIAKRITHELGQAQILKKSIELSLKGVAHILDHIEQGITLFKIKDIQGSVTAADLASGKLPLVKTFSIEMNMPGKKPLTITYRNIAFDFKNPLKSAQEIIKTIIKPSLHF